MSKLFSLFCFFGFNVCAVIENDWYFDSIEESEEFNSADNLTISKEISIVLPISLDVNLETNENNASTTLDILFPGKDFNDSSSELESHVTVIFMPENNEEQEYDLKSKTYETTKDNLEIPVTDKKKNGDANDQVFPVVGEVTFGGLVNSYGRVSVAGKSSDNNEFITISRPTETTKAVPLLEPQSNVAESNLPATGTINFSGTVRASGSISVSGTGRHFGDLSGTPHFVTTSSPRPTAPWMMASFGPMYPYYFI